MNSNTIWLNVCVLVWWFFELNATFDRKKTHRRSIPERGHWTDRHDTIWVYLKRDFHDLSLKSSSDSTKHGYCNHRIGRFSHVFPTFSVKPILPACLRLLLIQRNFFWWRCNTSPPLRRYGIFYTSHSHSRFPSRKPPISCGDFHICGFFTYVPMISTSTQEELMRWAQHAMISTTIIFDHFWGAHSNVISLKYGELMANYSNLTGTDNCSIGLWQHVEAVPACVGNYNTLSMIHMYIYILYGGFLK